MKRWMIVWISGCLLLSSCAGSMHELNEISYEKKEALPGEQRTDFWESLVPFSYTAEETSGPAERILYTEESPIAARSSDAYVLSFNLNGLPYRYDEQTGNLVCLHTDPVCQHGGGECPFSMATGGFREHNGCVYFTAWEIPDPDEPLSLLNPSTGKEKADRVWNMDSMSVKTIRRRPFGVMCEVAVYDGEDRYVYDISYREDDRQEIWTLLRQNLKTGRTEILEESEGQPPLLVAVRNGVFLWLDSNYEILYRSEADALLERRELCRGVREGNIFAEGDYLWFPAHNGDEYGLVSCRYWDGATEFLSLPGFTDSAIFRESYDMTDRYVYYLSGQERTVTVKAKDGRNETSILSPGKLVRLDRETGEVEDILVLDNEIAGVSLYDFVISGHYLYAPLCFVENETYYGLGGSQILRIDLNDRSRYVIAAPDLNEG